DERRRIAASAEGGIWLMRTPEPEPVTALAGTRKAVETTRRLRRFPFWAHQGSSRLAEIPVVDASLIRGLDVGQVAYLYRGGVTYLQVKRLVASPAAVSAAEAEAETETEVEPEPERTKPVEAATLASLANALPDVSLVLDAAFGPEEA